MVSMRWIGLFIAFFCGTAVAQDLDINLSNDTAEVKFEAPIASTGVGRSSFDLDLLYADQKVDNNWLTGVGYTVSGNAGRDVPGLKFGVGVKAYVLEVARF
ncbi:MAG: hypothetical protein FD130_1852, partial [Halothiobacillaceae bacterium]